MTADAVLVSTATYWLIASVAGGLFLITALRTEKIPMWVFLTGIAVVLFAFRWPVVFSNIMVNRDEEFMLAGAITLKHFAKFWIYVDGSTSGPLNFYPLTFLGLLGMKLDNLPARLLSLAMIWGALAGMYFMLRNVLDEALARISILPSVAFFALAVHSDLLHYASELVPICLVSLGCCIYWKGILDRKNRPVFFGAMLLACVPWAKMQGAPIAALVSFGGALAMFFVGGGVRWKMLRAWLLGSVSPVAAVLALVTCWGAWPDFIRSLEFLLIYKGTNFSDSQFYLLFISNGAHFNAYWMPLTVTTMAALPFFLKRKHLLARPLPPAEGGSPARLVQCDISMTREGVWFLLAAAMVFGAWLAVRGTSWPAAHYLLFLVVPLGILTSVCFFNGFAVFRSDAAWRIFSIILFCCATLLPQIIFRATKSSRFLPFKKSEASVYISPPSELINKFAKPGDTLAIWGEHARLPIETQLPLATRISCNDLLYFPASQKFAIERFISDVALRRPRFFVDVPAPRLINPGRVLKHEIVPALQQLVAANYTLLAEADGVRVYVRNGSDGLSK
jgi:hypothetical protein